LFYEISLWSVKNRILLNRSSHAIFGEGIDKVMGFKIVADYTVWVLFDDGSEQTIDFKPILYGEMWGSLRDKALFDQVDIDPVAKTLAWPNGADFDPETLRNWPDYVAELAVRAKTWIHVPVV